jgi:hypothetical protein
MNARRIGWLLAAAVCGVAAGLWARLLGVGPLRAEAPWLGVLAALFAYGLRFVRLRPPERPPRAREAALSPRGRALLLLALAGWTLAGVALSLSEALGGYRELEPAALADPARPPAPGFYAAAGRPMLDALYAMSGSEGDRFLAPLDAFDGHLVIVTAERPTEDPVRVTGRLRTDLKTVLESRAGEPVGPFLPQYRERVGLPPDAPVYFLDTGVRAGLDVRTLLHVAAPLYLFLLALGAPVRRG